MILRKYQDVMILNMARKIHKGIKNLVAQLATGGGKTVVFCAIIKRWLERNEGGHALVAVHRKELLAQCRKTAYNGFELSAFPIVAGIKYIPPADMYVAMIESLMRRLEKLKAAGANIGLLIIDECHIGSFNKLIPAIRELYPNVIIIGFSATPLARSKKLPLKNFYDDIVCGVDIPELIALNREHPGEGLCQNITWAPKDTVDRLELAVKNGEFDDAAMALSFSKPKYIHNTVTAYEKWCKGKKTIVFNVNIEHSKIVDAAFVKAGYNSRHLDSEMSKGEREQVLYWFKHTPDAILQNVGIATTGFDEPTIEAGIINKATLSMPLWLQMCGRASRPIGEMFITQKKKEYSYPLHPKSLFTLIDMGGNAVAHGDWCAARDWESIFHDPPKPGKSTAAPVKNCPNCDAIVPASTKKCPYCGYLWADKEIAIEAELHEFIVVTKGIDAAALMKEHEDKKQYYSFFTIGRVLAEQAANTIPAMSDEYANFVLGKYFDLGREWCKLNKKRFNQWHQEKAKEILFAELKTKFPKWKTELVIKKREDIPGVNLSHQHKVEKLKQIKSLNRLQ
jgi:superfamily II DNA or RNA helicase